MTSLLTLAMGFLNNGDLVDGMAKKLKIEPANLQKILVIAVPLLITALSKNSSSTTGANALFNAVANDHDGSILDQADSFLSNPGVAKGGNILKHVLGDQTSAMTDQLADMAGVDPKVANQVLGMAAPVVLGALGKMNSEGGLSASSLPSILTQASEMAESKVPGLMGALKGFLDSDGDGKIDDSMVQLGTSLLSKLMK
ncbi:MAG: DUF937 domain-containing protein [Leptonema sp. (in: Bacteria)]|nr:DUF937 domain-containing protein [Leptonema sp. (in: bacteria)]